MAEKSSMFEAEEVPSEKTRAENTLLVALLLVSLGVDDTQLNASEVEAVLRWHIEAPLTIKH